MTAARCACGQEITGETQAMRHVKVCPGQGLPATWTIADYTAAINRSRRAYHGDRNAEDGGCAECGGERAGKHRLCNACLYRQYRAGRAS